MGKSEQALFRAIPKIQEATAKSIKEILDAILAIAAQQRDNEMVRLLLEHEKAGKNIDFEICRGFAYKDFEKKLSDNNIPHTIYYHQVSGAMVIATRDADRERVSQLKNELFAEQGRVTRLNNEDFNKLYVGQRVETLCDLSVVESKTFTQLAKQYGLTMTVKLNSENPSRCDVAYNVKDRAKAQKVLAKTMMMTSGDLGKLQTLTCEREIQFQKDVLTSIQDPQKELYVVSKTNPKEYYHFNRDGLEYYRNSVLIRTINRNDKQFVRNSANYISTLVNPVTLSKKEFEVSEQERLANVRNKSARLPKLERDTHREDLERMARKLIEDKMSLDNSDLRSVPTSLYDPKVSFEEFVRIENINDNKLTELAKDLDQLHKEEKILVKDYIKEVIVKVDSVRSYEAYIDPELDELTHAPAQQYEARNEELRTPGDEDAPPLDVDFEDTPPFDVDNEIYNFERE